MVNSLGCAWKSLWDIKNITHCGNGPTPSFDDYRRLQNLTNRIQRALKDEILLTPHVKLLPKGTLPVSEGKAVRVVDKRTVYQ